MGNGGGFGASGDAEFAQDAGDVGVRRTQRGELGVATDQDGTSLLVADELDRLSVTLCPELVGGGSRLFDETIPATSWTLTHSTPTESGALCLYYDRTR